MIDGWTERGRNAMVEIEEDAGTVVVRSTDRLICNGMRFVSIGLLLVGLLVVGLQLLRMSEDRVDSLALLRETPLLSSLAVIALVAFFAGCLVFSLRPGTLAALSAEVRQQPQEHPCERLAAQRDRLIAAQQVDHAGPGRRDHGADAAGGARLPRPAHRERDRRRRSSCWRPRPRCRRASRGALGRPASRSPSPSPTTGRATPTR